MCHLIDVVSGSRGCGDQPDNDGNDQPDSGPAEDQPGKCHAAAALPGPAHLPPCRVTEHDRGNRGQAQGGELAYTAPMGTPTVKRAWRIHPVTLPAVAGLGGDCDMAFPRRCGFAPSRRGESSWSARSAAPAGGGEDERA